MLVEKPLKDSDQILVSAFFKDLQVLEDVLNCRIGQTFQDLNTELCGLDVQVIPRDDLVVLQDQSKRAVLGLVHDVGVRDRVVLGQLVQGQLCVDFVKSLLRLRFKNKFRMVKCGMKTRTGK